MKDLELESRIGKPAVGRGVVLALGAFGLTFVVLMIVMLAALGSVVRLG